MNSISPRGVGRIRVVLLIGLLGTFSAGATAAAPQIERSNSSPLLVQQARIQPPADVAAEDGFGGGVISADGRTVLLTAVSQDCSAGPDCGAVYVFALVQGAWMQQAKLTSPNRTANDLFGFSMALSANGDIALIGDFSHDCALGQNCGEAYIFERSGGVWGAGVPLDSPNPQAFASYGSSMGLSGAGDMAVVGAPNESCPPLAPFGCGAAHIFRRTGGLWSLETTLHPDLSPNNGFGGPIKVSRDGRTLFVVGDINGGASPGAIYVFQQTGGIWNREAKILPPINDDVRTFTLLAVSGNGQKVLTWSELPGIGPPHVLSVYVRGVGGWTQQGPPLPTSESGGLSGGLSFDGDKVLVGLLGGGKAQLFGWNGSTWSLLQDLAPAEPDAPPALSSTVVALSDDAKTALVVLGVCSSSCREIPFIFAADAFSPDVPTLGQLGLALLALLIVGSGALLLRRRTA